MTDRFGVFNRSQIPPLREDDLDAVNSPTDGYVPSYDEASGKFEWVSNAGGVSTLADLTDVVFDSGTPADNQVLTYDAGTGKWKSEDASGGASQLSELTDVNTSTPTNRYVLVADGVDWESRALVEADISDLGTYLKNLLEDTTPQLGGDLDLNGKNIDFPTVANISDVKDEDDMATDSATMLATQQSIKAYVDTKTKTTFGISIDGSGGVIETGVKGFIRIPYGATLTGWTLIADVSGSIKIDVWKDVWANYPATDADSITNGHEPEISSATKAEDTDISDWSSVTVTAGDVIFFNVDSCTTITKITLIIEITKT